jgi:hypothetical protein
MIEMAVDPAADDFFDRRKIDNHAKRIEPVRLDSDQRPAVVAMEMAAFAVVLK